MLHDDAPTNTQLILQILQDMTHCYLRAMSPIHLKCLSRDLFTPSCIDRHRGPS